MILIKNMGAKPVECAHYRKRLGVRSLNNALNRDKQLAKYKSHGCSNELALDQGYRVYSIDVSHSKNISNDQIYQQPLLIFASVYQFPKPAWVEASKQDEVRVTRLSFNIVCI